MTLGSIATTELSIHSPKAHNCLYPDTIGLVGLLVAWVLGRLQVGRLVGKPKMLIGMLILVAMSTMGLASPTSPNNIHIRVHRQGSPRLVVQMYPANMNF
jgi:hypothetical protein